MVDSHTTATGLKLFYQPICSEPFESVDGCISLSLLATVAIALCHDLVMVEDDLHSDQLGL